MLLYISAPEDYKGGVTTVTFEMQVGTFIATKRFFIGTTVDEIIEQREDFKLMIVTITARRTTIGEPNMMRVIII